jgi:hypothetical protein
LSFFQRCKQLGAVRLPAFIVKFHIEISPRIKAEGIFNVFISIFGRQVKITILAGKKPWFSTNASYRLRVNPVDVEIDFAKFAIRACDLELLANVGVIGGNFAGSLAASAFVF